MPLVPDEGESSSLGGVKLFSDSKDFVTVDDGPVERKRQKPDLLAHRKVQRR